ncbi:MAG: 5-formyltetrahydrofolate cyclo-ligase [Spirochaetales bacterium]|jgi:5-formyltetrahydrofolate cyclo-ligase|nr:5-formyltetrahydrofolate cyclo-ligase [Spirochaetales bacterium]
MTKQDYRALIKPQLLSFPYSVTALKKALSECKEFIEAKVILSFMPIKGEIDLAPILKLYPEKQVLYPVVVGHNIIFATSPNFKRNKWNILEPDSLREESYESAVMFTPGLLFDKEKNRLGRGKGFYDRYIKKNRSKLYTIGIGKKNQLVEKLPAEEFDEKLDCVFILFEADDNFVQIT